MASINTERIKKVLSFKEGVFREIRDDKAAMVEAIIVMYLAAVVGGFWGIIQTLGFALIGIAIGTPIAWVIGTGIFHIIAKLVGGKSSYEGYLKATAYASAPNALGIIPFIGGLIGGLWGLALFVVATKEAHELSLGKAIFVVLLPLLALALLAFLLAAMLMPYFVTYGGYGSMMAPY